MDGVYDSSNGVYRGVNLYFNFFTDGESKCRFMVKNGCSIEGDTHVHLPASVKLAPVP